MASDRPRHTLKGSWEWLEFAASLPSQPNQFIAVTAGQLLLSGRYLVTGITINNTSTNAGTVTLYDGQDTTGTIVLAQHFSASGTQTTPTVPNGVLCEIGVFMNVTAGSISGAVWAVPLSEIAGTPPGE